MKDKIIKEHYFNHPIGKVWAAISKAEEISKWFVEAQFEAKEGFEYTFKHEQTIIEGRVLKAEPVYELVYTWVVKGTDVETVVSWQLRQQVEGTLLTLVHSGISNYNAQTAIMMFDNYQEGWKTCILNLKNYLNPNA